MENYIIELYAYSLRALFWICSAYGISAVFLFISEKLIKNTCDIALLYRAYFEYLKKEKNK